MADNRPRVALNGRKINLRQLSNEVGTSLTANEEAVVVVDPNSTVKQADLEAAVNRHVANDLVEPTMQEQLDALTATLVSKGTLTAAEVASTKARKPRGH